MDTADKKRYILFTTIPVKAQDVRRIKHAKGAISKIDAPGKIYEMLRRFIERIPSILTESLDEVLKALVADISPFRFAYYSERPFSYFGLQMCINFDADGLVATFDSPYCHAKFGVGNHLKIFPDKYDNDQYLKSEDVTWKVDTPQAAVLFSEADPQPAQWSIFETDSTQTWSVQYIQELGNPLYCRITSSVDEVFRATYTLESEVPTFNVEDSKIDGKWWPGTREEEKTFLGKLKMPETFSTTAFRSLSKTCTLYRTTICGIIHQYCQLGIKLISTADLEAWELA